MQGSERLISVGSQVAYSLIGINGWTVARLAGIDENGYTVDQLRSNLYKDGATKPNSILLGKAVRLYALEEGQVTDLTLKNIDNFLVSCWESSAR